MKRETGGFVADVEYRTRKDLSGKARIKYEGTSVSKIPEEVLPYKIVPIYVREGRSKAKKKIVRDILTMYYSQPNSYPHRL